MPRGIYKRTERHKKILSIAQLNGNNWMRGKYETEHFRWKGDKATYNSIHRYVQKNWDKKGVCSHCGKKGKTDWANIDHKYNRENKNDWIELCRKCHIKFDKEKKFNDKKFHNK